MGHSEAYWEVARQNGTTRYPRFTSVKNLTQMGGGDVLLPPEVGWIVKQKIKFVASTSKKIFLAWNHMLSFQVVSIIETYKSELQPIAFGPQSIRPAPIS